MSSNKAVCCGINFEGGKIIKHVLQSKYCRAYANIQIAMDAPYHGRVADEKLRNKGRSELQFPPKYGYSDILVQCKIYKIIQHVQEKYPDTKIVMQIARGRSGLSMYDEVLRPILFPLGLISSDGVPKDSKLKVVYGYKSADYYQCSRAKSNFVFINIGMFAVLSNVNNVRVGSICNPTITYNVSDIDMRVTGKHTFNNKNILNTFPDIPKIILCGIADDMPFITPDVYSKQQINRLLDTICPQN
jgi:hypothetical protein